MIQKKYEEALKKANDLNKKILAGDLDLVSDSLKEDYQNRLKYIKGLSIDKAWVKFFFHANRAIILQATSVAAALVMAFFFLFQFNQQYQDEVLADIYPAEGSITVKLPSGEIVSLDSGLSHDSRLEGALVDEQKKKISYHSSSNDVSLGKEKVQSKVEYHELIIPKGKSFSLELSDGSKVWINSESSIRYPVSFAENERVVFVEGEAFFDVARDAGKPFIVKTADYDIRVLGTKFNVKSYKDEEFVATTLVSGVVSIPLGQNKENVMQPGEQLKYSRTNKLAIVEKVDTELYTSWVNNSLKLSGTPLHEIVSLLQRRYNVSFVFNDDVLKNETFTGVIPLNERLSVILEMFSKVSSVQFQIENGLVIVSKK